MKREEQLELVRKHYALNSAGDFAAAGELLTEDFSITIPSSMPFAGTYRGKGAFRELIPIVAQAVPIVRLRRWRPPSETTTPSSSSSSHPRRRRRPAIPGRRGVQVPGKPDPRDSTVLFRPHAHGRRHRAESRGDPS